MRITFRVRNREIAERLKELAPHDRGSFISLAVAHYLSTEEGRMIWEHFAKQGGEVVGKPGRVGEGKPEKLDVDKLLLQKLKGDIL